MSTNDFIIENGVLEKCNGEIGEELVIPEGVVSVHYPLDVSKCKKIVIPSTIEQLSSDVFYGPAPDLAEFVVSPDDDYFLTIDGHLSDVTGALCLYAPATSKKGILPARTYIIEENAFCLIDEPLEKLCIPAICDFIGPQYTKNGWFYQAEVDAENESFKAIDGSIYSIDGKTLVRAKISKDGFIVADGTEIIDVDALHDVYKRIYIPASVTRIQSRGNYGCVYRIHKGSYAEKWVKEMGFAYELILENGDIEECKPEPVVFSKTGHGFSF